MQQIKSFWDGLDTRRRLIAALATVAIVAGIVGIARVAAEPDMALLYSGLDATAAGEVVAALEAEGIAFSVSDSAILVDRTARDRIRMTLAARNLPAGGPAGYEILDGLSGFGTTSQMFDAAYWRAKEGELARTITGSPDVRAARVHLANPVSQPFSRTPAGSASVTVTMARGELSRGQAEAIRYLVSSAVAGVSPEAVAVMDAARGVVLAGKDDALGGNGPNPDQRAETLRANIQRLLEARVGPGHAIVEVNVDADMDSQTISERTVDPDSRVAISTDTEESAENASGTNPGVTVASNLPDGDVGSNQGNNSRNATTSRERQNFEVSETRRERVVLPGQVRRISVAVMVDGIASTAADGSETWAPRPDSEIETLRQLVQSAMGYDENRGDVVTISSLQFTPPAEQGAVAERGRGFLDLHGARLIQLGVLAGIILALILFVLRPMASRLPIVEIAQLDRAAGPRLPTAGPDRRRRHPRPAGPDRDQDRAPPRRHRQPHRRLGRGPPGVDRVLRKRRGNRAAHERLSPRDLLARPTAAAAARAEHSTEERLEAVREAAWHAGFLEGQAMATEAHLDDQTRLTSAFVEALADARVTNEAARHHVAASVAPMIEALVDAIAPTLADAGLAGEIARLVERALLHAPGGKAAPASRAGNLRHHRGGAPRARSRRHARGGAGAPAARGADLLGPGLRPSRSRRLHRARARLHRVPPGTNAGEDHDRRQRG